MSRIFYKMRDRNCSMRAADAARAGLFNCRRVQPRDIIRQFF